MTVRSAGEPSDTGSLWSGRVRRRMGMLSGIRRFLKGLTLRQDHPPGDSDVGEVGGHFDHAGLAGARRVHYPDHRPAHRQGLTTAEPEDALELGSDRRLWAGVLPVTQPP